MNNLLNNLENFKNRHKILYFIMGFILFCIAAYFSFNQNFTTSNFSRHLKITIYAGFYALIFFIFIYIATHFVLSLLFKFITGLSKEKSPVRLINYYCFLVSLLIALSTVPWTIAEALLTLTVAILLPVFLSFYKGGNGNTVTDRLDNALYQNNSPRIDTEHSEKETEKTNSQNLTTHSVGKWIIKHDSSLTITNNNQGLILVKSKDTTCKNTPLLDIKSGKNSLTIKQSSIYKIILEDKSVTIIKK